MSGWRPLPYYGPVDWTRVRAAKDALWVDYKVVPTQVEGPNAWDRVLAWGGPPPFPCEYAVAADSATDEEIEQALAWVLGEPGADVGMTLDQVLATIIGPGVREITAEELAEEEAVRRRLAEYQ